jgi:signal transduction histidine kinase
MKNTLSLQVKLQNDFIQRSRSGTFFHIALALSTLLAFQNQNPDWWFLLHLFIMLLAPLRYLSVLFYKNMGTLSIGHMILLKYSLLVIALTWGILTAWSFHAHGVMSLQSICFTFILSGLLTGSVSFMRIYPKLHFAYATLMCLPGILEVSDHLHDKNYFMFLILFSLMYAFIGLLSYNSHFDILKTHTTELDLQNALESLKVQTAKAEHSSRLATIGEMAAGIAHEINNPLAIIVANTQLLLKNKELSVQSQGKLQTILNTSQRISKIIIGLKLFSRQSDKDPMSPHSVKKIVSDTLEFCLEKFRSSGVDLKTDQIEDQYILCRPSQLSQVLLNLLNNSFDAIQLRDEKWIKIQTLTENNHFILKVVDSGNGIPADVINKIFDPFFTTKGVGKGTGLGLSISKGIIQDHFGNLNYKTENGHTCFEIIIPIHQHNQKLAA